MSKVLIIDDEAQIRSLLSRIIMLEGYEVIQAESLKQAAQLLLSHRPEVILCDVFLPDGSGVDFITQIKSKLPHSEVVMLTANGNIQDGVQAIKNGAFDYLIKGDDNNRIIPLLANAAQKVALTARLQQLESLMDQRYSFDTIIGTSRSLLDAVDLAKRVAPTDTSILLTGETGTGKEVFAHAIHNASLRSKGAFVAVNCSALSKELLESELFGYKAGAFTGAVKDKKGLFEQAHKGTIFLDELGEMPLNLQAKLLRTLESGEFIKVGDSLSTHADVRVIAATNRDLKEAVAQGEFREDLFYRLSVFAIELPPLRGRKEDIRLLAQCFIEHFSSKVGKAIVCVDPLFYKALESHQWSGNVRELRNVIERSLIIGREGTLTLSDLPYEIQLSDSNYRPGDMELSSMERAHIVKVLRHTAGNKTEAARLLKIGLTTLYRKLEEYQIST